MKRWMTSVKTLIVCLAVLGSASCGKGPTGLPEINGVKGPLLNLVDGKILLTMKFLNMNFDVGFKAPIPKTLNSSMELAPNVVDGGMMITLHIAVEDLRAIDIGVGDGNYLPDGRPVPGIPGGRLEDSLRLDTPWKGISFFYHKKLFGVWIPFGFETAGISGYWNININNKNVGMLGLVGDDQAHGYKAGGLVFLRLENLNDKQFKRLIKLSKQNPHHIY